MARFILDCEDEEIDKGALAAALSDEANSDTALSAEIVFTDGAAMQKLNAEARGVDAVTDVLSFPNLDEIKNREIKGEDFPSIATRRATCFGLCHHLPRTGGRSRQRSSGIR